MFYRYMSGICMQVVGVDNKGYDFQRTTPTAISPLEPSAPVVETEKITRGFYEEMAILTCSVTSLIPFALQWYRNGVELGNKLFYRFRNKLEFLIDLNC